MSWGNLSAATLWAAVFEGMGPVRITWLLDGNARHCGTKKRVNFPDGITADDFRKIRVFSGDAITAAGSFSEVHTDRRLRRDADNCSLRILDTYEFPLVGQYRDRSGGQKVWIPRAFGIHLACTLGELADYRDRDGNVHPLAVGLPSFDLMVEAARAHASADR